MTIEPRPLPAGAPARIRIERLGPSVDGGRYRVKRTVGETVTVGADILRDGHDVLRARLRWKQPGCPQWSETVMVPIDADRAGVRWEGSLLLDELGLWESAVTAWVDPMASWRRELERKVEAGQEDLGSELVEGAALLAAASDRAGPEDQALLAEAAAITSDLQQPVLTRLGAALAADVADACDRNPDRSVAAATSESITIDVDPTIARNGAWYELFPRSWGGLDGVRGRLPALAQLGFDVVYLPPIHPIGHTNRKGANNTLLAGPDDPGSPWAIGDDSGGHTAVHADLGTIADVEALVAEARAVGIEIALDYAIQCSADHPWLTEHPEWFHRRPDGSLKFAENPPKKYQDIYNVDFDCEQWRELWAALFDVVAFWVERGVRVFRVDNPHTKPLVFWEWLIGSIRAQHPDVVFLAEAFTRRAIMQELARIGFDQSYTYFTWKSSRWELTEYLSELTTSGEQAYFRPNFFVNTPDILTEELQLGGPAKFISRLILAATLSPSYGIYSGFECFERTPIRPGSEEYLDSEKYQRKERTLDGPLLPLVAHLNRIRRTNVALQHFDNLTFLETENEALIAYVKQTGDNALIVVVTLDPAVPQEGVVVVPAETGLPAAFDVCDLLTGERFRWQLGRNYVRLTPGLGPPERPAHLLRVENR